MTWTTKPGSTKKRLVYDGRPTEKFTDLLFTKNGYYVDRIPDSRSAGGFIKSNTSDFIVGKNLITFFLEAKSTIQRTFYKTNLSSSQMKKAYIALKKGVAGAYLITLNQGKDIYVYDWARILIFYGGKKKGTITKQIKPLLTFKREDPMTHRTKFDDIPEFDTREFNKALVAAIKEHRPTVMEMDFDFGEKKKYGKVKL